MTEREALRLARRALLFAHDDGYKNEISHEALAAIREVLAQPEQCRKKQRGNGEYVCNCKSGECPELAQEPTCKQSLQVEQEPVAWMNGWGDLFKHFDDAERGQTIQPLYANPPQRTWVGLTFNDLQDVENQYDCTTSTGRMFAYQAIEAKLKEKNT